MSGHTQGPWTIKFQQSRRGTTDYTDKYWHDQWAIKGPNMSHSPVAMVRVEGLGSGPSMAVRKANARLIAAAPDLLAALENLMDGACEALSFLDRETVRHLKPLIDSAETAITKAKGANQ